MSRLFYIIIWLLVIFAIVNVYISIPVESAYYKGADEGYYLFYATAISRGGFENFPILAKWYTSDIYFSRFPSPFRVGHILFSSLWGKLFGINFVSLAYFSLFAFIVFLAISFLFCKKFFDIDTAHFYILLLSSSPLLSAMGRRALSDSNGNLFFCLAIWLFLFFLARPNRIRYISLLLVFFFSILIRESSLMLLVFFTLFFVIHKYFYKNKLANGYLVGLYIFPLLLYSLSLIILFGGVSYPLSLIKIKLHHHFAGLPSSYALYCTGPWYRYIVDFLLLSPAVTLLFIGYFSYILVSRKFEWKIIYFFLCFLIIFIVLSNLKYTKVVRFAISLEMIINLFAVLMLYELFRHVDKAYQKHLILLVSVLLFFLNYFSFRDIFCTKDVYDPISCQLLRAREILPDKVPCF